MPLFYYNEIKKVIVFIIQHILHFFNSFSKIMLIFYENKLCLKKIYIKIFNNINNIAPGIPKIPTIIEFAIFNPI